MRPCADDRLAVVGLALQGAGDLDRLDLAPEDLGEGALDEPSEAPLEALQDSHRRRPFPAVGDRIRA